MLCWPSSIPWGLDLRSYWLMPSMGVLRTSWGLKEAGTALVAPLKRRVRHYGNFGADEFTYLEAEGTLRCPAGKTARYRVHNERGLLFRAPAEAGGGRLRPQGAVYRWASWGPPPLGLDAL